MLSGSRQAEHAPAPAEAASPPPDCDAHRSWPWHRRLASAAGRRMRALWRRTGSHGRPSVEAAIEWLRSQSPSSGLPARQGGPACSGTTAAMLPTLVEFGQLDLARSWCEWLLKRQLPDGSFSRSDAAVGSVFNTAQAVAALTALAAEIELPQTAPLRRAGNYLAGRLLAGWMPGAGAMYQVRVASELACLPALATAACVLDMPDWNDVVERTVAHARRVVDWRLAQSSLRLVPWVAEAWLTLGETDLARETLRGAALMQRRDGAIPAVAKGCWGDHALLAHLAAIWYRLGERDPADLALAQLARHQLQSGGWHESWGRGERVRESAWVVKHYLDAAQWQVHSSFSAELTALPQTIAADDGRLRAVEQWMTGFAAGEKVADVGCGPGRFVRILRERFPQVRLVGIDPAEAMLSRLPAQVEARRGGLLHLPGRAGEFAGALAVESLEHALLPRQAVAELCRVVRPGGRLLIIDKHVRSQSLSLCQPWERWFLPEEVSAWLAPYCDEVTVRGVSHGPNERGNGLFLCWQARRT